MMLTAWITVTATMIVLLIVPAKQKQHLRAHTWVLAIPSFWIMFRLVAGYSDPSAMVHPVLFAIGAISFGLCVPYALYLVVRIANPGLSDLSEVRLRVILAVIAVFFMVSGYGIGLNLERFQSCEELELHGDGLPAHCVQADEPLAAPGS